MRFPSSDLSARTAMRVQTDFYVRLSRKRATTHSILILARTFRARNGWRNAMITELFGLVHHTLNFVAALLVVAYVLIAAPAVIGSLYGVRR